MKKHVEGKPCSRREVSDALEAWRITREGSSAECDDMTCKALSQSGVQTRDRHPFASGIRGARECSILLRSHARPSLSCVLDGPERHRTEGRCGCSVEWTHGPYRPIVTPIAPATLRSLIMPSL